MKMTHHKKHQHEHDGPPDLPQAGDEQGMMAKARAEGAQQDAAPPAAPAAESQDPVAKLTAERDDYLDRLQRVSAEFLNYQKRAQREIADARERADCDLIKGLLPVLDDMERALDAARSAKGGGDDPLLAGMQLVHEKALGILQRRGLEVIEAKGKPFDPEKHQAVSQMPTDEHAPNTVLQDLQKGYMLGGRTLRPSMVVVAKPVEKQADGQ